MNEPESKPPIQYGGSHDYLEEVPPPLSIRIAAVLVVMIFVVFVCYFVFSKLTGQ